MTHNIIGILLAAGQSKRFGSNKLMHVLENGMTIAEQSGRTLIQQCPNSIAIVEDTDSALSKTLATIGFTLVENKQSIQGMSSSLVRGITASNHASGWLITLADMPYIRADSLQQIINAWDEQASIVLPHYHDVPGHPVLFSKHFYSSLIQLEGDVGAKSILMRNTSDVVRIDLDDPGILKDIDNPDDVA